MHKKTGALPWLKTAANAESVLETKSRNANLTLARFRHDGNGTREFQSPPDDAFVAILQISEMPPHEFCFDRKIRYQPGGSSQSFNVADLNAAPYCSIDAPTESFQLHIPRKVLDDLADDAEAPPIGALRAPNGWETRDAIVESIKQTLIAVTQPGQFVSQLFVDHTLLALHAHIAHTYGGLRRNPSLLKGGLAPWQERLAKEMIAANLIKEQSISEIAAECGLSTAHFSRAFKVTTGMAPHSWLQRCRVERAKDLLLGSSLSLAEIALAGGFADQSHFSRVFSVVTGNTPGAWRRSYRM